jgi:hypothetical protein
MGILENWGKIEGKLERVEKGDEFFYRNSVQPIPK